MHCRTTKQRRAALRRRLWRTPVPVSVTEDLFEYRGRIMTGLEAWSIHEALKPRKPWREHTGTEILRALRSFQFPQSAVGGLQ